MNHSILKPAFALLFLVAFGSAPQGFSREHFSQAFGYSSEESGGGSAYLGVDTRDISPDRLNDLKLKEEHGVEITMVDQDAPAGKAGLKEHDVILTLNGTEVESVEQLRRMIREIPPGRVVTLGISRDGQPMTIKAQLADRKLAMGSGHEHFKYAMPAMPVMPAMPAMPVLPDIDVPVNIVVVHSSLRSGLMVENLTPQLGDFFGAKNGQGVLVRSVEKGSRAEKAGFHAGDVIVRVNGETVNDTGDFTHALRGHKDKDNAISVGIIRDKKEQTITLTLPERKQSGLRNQRFDISDLEGAGDIDLTNLKAEVDRIKPELERATSEMQTEELERAKPELEEATRELRDHKKELRQEMREVQRELQEQGR